jgi:ABC-type hemin transport system ATPase subunit
MTDGAVAGLLEATSVELVPGEVVVAVGRPGHGNVALALALAGRLRLSAGRVDLAGDPALEARQNAVVLVDVPGVTEPDDSVPFRVIVAEELALAGLPSGPHATSAWLREHRLGTSPRLRTEDVPALDRIRSLTELGAARPDARFLVLLSPDRHGLHRRDWWPIAQAAADRGLGVLVTVSEAADLGDIAHLASIGGAA